MSLILKQKQLFNILNQNHFDLKLQISDQTLLEELHFKNYWSSKRKNCINDDAINQIP